MAPTTEGCAAGPRLLRKYLNTTRPDYKISALLDELDMKNKAERSEFQHFLKDYMTWDPVTGLGYKKHEFAALDDNHMRCYTEQFLDMAQFEQRPHPAGQTYFPPRRLEDDPQTSKNRKKWNYDDHRSGIIDVVTQIMTTQRNGVKKMDAPKRSRNPAPRGTDVIWTDVVESAESDDDYTPSSSPALKRPRRNTGAPASAHISDLGSHISTRATIRTEPTHNGCCSEPASAPRRGNDAQSSAESEPTRAETTPNSRHSESDNAHGRSNSQSETRIPPIVTSPTSRLARPGQTADAQRKSTNAGPGHQMPSTPPGSSDGHSDLDAIIAARQLALQGMKIANEPGKTNPQERDVQVFNAGIQHARQHFAATCMDMQLSAKEVEGPEREQLEQKAQVLLDLLHDFNKAMMRSKAKLPAIMRTLDIE